MLLILYCFEVLLLNTPDKHKKLHLYGTYYSVDSLNQLGHNYFLII